MCQITCVCVCVCWRSSCDAKDLWVKSFFFLSFCGLFDSVWLYFKVDRHVGLFWKHRWSANSLFRLWALHGHFDINSNTWTLYQSCTTTHFLHCALLLSLSLLFLSWCTSNLVWMLCYIMDVPEVTQVRLFFGVSRSPETQVRKKTCHS